ncbi:MAG: porin family protein [Acidobacteriota bacterium]
MTIALASPALAQSIGVMGGVSLVDLAAAGDFTSTTSPRIGGVVGGFVGLPIAGRLSLRGEVTVGQDKTTLEDVVDDDLSYLDVAVLARYRLRMLGGSRALHAIGGPVYRSLLSATESVSGQSSDISEGIESSELALAFGLDVEFRPRWIAGVRYLYGFSDVYRTLRASVGRHRGLRFIVSYRLR